MFNRSNKFREEVARSVCNALPLAAADLGADAAAVKAIDADQVMELFTLPPDAAHGQLALPCFAFAKALRQAPPKVAAALAARIEASAAGMLARAQAAGGYLNIHGDAPEVARWLLPAIAEGSLFGNGILAEREREKIVVEYSQPNTHKALHVGHMRCLVLGDAVSRALAYVGHDVVKVTYPGDLGTHIAKVLWYLEFRNTEPAPAEHKGEWLGRKYAEAEGALQAAEAEGKGPEVKAEMSRILASLKARQGESYEIWKRTREWSLDEMRKVYEWMGVSFDTWYYESECDGPSAELVKRKYEEGFFVKDDGAIGIDLSPYKLGFAMFLKRDGNGLYITKDLELLERKFEDPAVTRSIVVVDSRQKLHFQQLFKTAELMGYPQAARSVHLAYETVNTADGKAFSSRQLNGLQIAELRSEMEAQVRNSYLERYRGEWSDAEIEKTAQEVAIGALKYGMLRVDNNTQVNFVLDEWLKLDGDTGPYLQYVHARCKNILVKQGAGTGEAGTGGAPFFPNFELPVENELLYFLLRFNDVAVQAAVQLRPTVISAYLFDLAKMFNRFYEQCPVRGTAGDQRATRLALVEAVAAVMERGLAVLGIPAPERM